MARTDFLSLKRADPSRDAITTVTIGTAHPAVLPPIDANENPTWHVRGESHARRQRRKIEETDRFCIVTI